VHAKVRVLDREAWAIAVAGGVHLPTATASSWLGSGALWTGGRAIVERRRPGWRLAANLGVRVRSGGDAIYRDDGDLMSTGATVAMGRVAIPAAAAAAWALSPGRIEVIGELSSQLASGGDYRPVETALALRVQLAEASHFTIGAGAGVGGAAGTPETRAFAAIVFEPELGRRRRDAFDDLEAPPPSPGAPQPGDRDDDRLVDTLDECPDQPEDLDDWQDDDGCPDVDNDGDRIVDVDDLCAEDPEDFDGDEDGDGCPEDDVVAVTEVGIETFEDVFFEFDSAVIDERSYRVLRAVARTILDNPSLRTIEVGGHTDDRGSAAYNRDLSQRRAEAVVAFLVEEGVPEERLAARGYGEDRPVKKGRGEAVWSANRRVEFVIAGER
jgi:outer membrane protein OmpA-like peptidoglycan-associated protein